MKRPIKTGGMFLHDGNENILLFTEKEAKREIRNMTSYSQKSNGLDAQGKDIIPAVIMVNA